MKRINHFVWLVNAESVAGYIEQLEGLLDTKFEVTSDESADAYVNWDSRLELIAPAANSSQGAAFLRSILKERGEGPFALAIRVPDLDAAADHARTVGFPVGVEFTPADPAERLAAIRSFTEKVDDIREIPIGTFLGLNLILCQVAYAEERDEVAAAGV